MKQSSLLACTLFALTALLAACGGGDDSDAEDGGAADKLTATATMAPDDTATAAPSANAPSGDDEFFQLSGTGVLTIEVGEETHELDVTCEVDKGKTLSDEPQWDYSLESADAAMIVQGTYQLVDGEETFKSLSVVAGALILSASEFENVTSGGTAWAGTFRGAGVEGTFETSCS